MTLKATPGATPLEVPLSGHAELLLSRLRERRQELVAHNPGAVELAAAILAAMHTAANGRTPELRGDRQVRYRVMQLMGERALPLEDLACVALEGEAGRAVAVAGLRVLVGALGYRLVANGDLPGPRPAEAAAALHEARGPVDAGITRALADDGHVDAVEAAELVPAVARLARRVDQLVAAVGRRAGSGVGK